MFFILSCIFSTIYSPNTSLGAISHRPPRNSKTTLHCHSSFYSRRSINPWKNYSCFHSPFSTITPTSAAASSSLTHLPTLINLSRSYLNQSTFFPGNFLKISLSTTQWSSHPQEGLKQNWWWQVDFRMDICHIWWCREGSQQRKGRKHSWWDRLSSYPGLQEPSRCGPFRQVHRRIDWFLICDWFWLGTRGW